MRKFKVFIISISFLGIFSPTYAATSLCGSNTRAIQCQSGKGGTGNGFYNPQMNPKFNPQVDPRFNPQADPRFNPKADPRFNPGATPCDLGIGRTCPKK